MAVIWTGLVLFGLNMSDGRYGLQPDSTSDRHSTLFRLWASDADCDARKAIRPVLCVPQWLFKVTGVKGNVCFGTLPGFPNLPSGPAPLDPDFAPELGPNCHKTNDESNATDGTSGHPELPQWCFPSKLCYVHAKHASDKRQWDEDESQLCQSADLLRLFDASL